MSQWIHGLHAVLEALKAGPGRIKRVVAVEGRNDARMREVFESARRAGVPVERQPLRAVERLAGDQARHQGVIALTADLAAASPEEILARIPSPAFVVILDSVEDPRNLGAVIRSAAAAGAGALFLPEHRAVGLTASVIKTSSGTALRLPVARVGNIAAFLRRLKEAGIWVIGLDQGGESLWTAFDLKLPVALVLGGEGKGLRRLTREHCDIVLSIPLSPGVESLNLSVAAGVALYEVVRQRGLNPR